MTNRLADSTSPYLLQHADNPVDWYPWGPEALERARAENRPILLSIGYSACHWCHVMERESFEDPAVAEVMNARFVNIKVDREERPDIDQVYMGAVQALTGGGGWPLTAFLTPDGRPFHGGTYYPPEPRHGMPSFRQVLDAVSTAYDARGDDVSAAADRLVAALRRDVPETSEVRADAALLDGAAAHLGARFDPVHGGFGRAPKFPQPTTLDVLLRAHARTGERAPLDQAIHTLRAMAAGGLRDHLAGGFHRYSVDAQWLVPHFEKMLYDNALLARVYLDAWKLTGASDLRGVCEQTLDYVLTDLRHPEGGFFSALDADSEGEEGTYYVWTPAEIRDELGERAEAFMRTYGVSARGNFEGRSILHLSHDLGASARLEDADPTAFAEEMAAARARLLSARARREPPFRDEKVLTGWNALTVRALAEAGAALGRPDYLDAARSGARFLLDVMQRDGRLMHVFKDGVVHVPAFLDDHAALGNALLSLHAATFEPDWLQPARALAGTIQEAFRDPATGVFYDTASDAEPLVIRPRDPTDGATPSGTSLTAEFLLRAGTLFDHAEWRDAATAVVDAHADAMARHPSAFGRLLGVVDSLVRDPLEIVVVGSRDSADTRALGSVAAGRYLPHATVTGFDPGSSEHDPESAETAGLALWRGRAGGRQPAAYVCRAFACRAPVHTAEALARELDGATSGS